MQKLLSISMFVFIVFISGPVRAETDETMKLLNLFGDVFEQIRQEYVEETDDRELIESSLNGMLGGLDPHSGYLDQKAFLEMQVQTKGEFGGLGIKKERYMGIFFSFSDTKLFQVVL